MNRKHGILLSIAVLLLLSLFFFIIISEHGYSDLRYLQKERDRLAQENQRLDRKNLDIGVEIDRLKNDPEYIENIARQELGMIAEDEIILKPKNLRDQKK
jgi:cell division protein FtsB